MSRELTARGVKAMLTRAGVGHMRLDIADAPSGSVRIDGPKEARRRVFWVLFDRGLAVAPFREHDLWSRPRGRR